MQFWVTMQVIIRRKKSPLSSSSYFCFIFCCIFDSEKNLSTIFHQNVEMYFWRQRLQRRSTFDGDTTTSKSGDLSTEFPMLRQLCQLRKGKEKEKCNSFNQMAQELSDATYWYDSFESTDSLLSLVLSLVPQLWFNFLLSYYKWKCTSMREVLV